MQCYISSELTHFVGRGLSEENQYQLLVKIITDGFLSHSPHSRCQSGNLVVKPNAKLSDNEMYNSQVVCFCGIPSEDLSLHMRKYGRFGLAFEKKFIVSIGGSPVFYIPKNSRIKRTKKITFADAIERSQTNKGPIIEEEIGLGAYFEEMFEDYHKSLHQKSELGDQIVLYLSLSRHIFSFIKFFDSDLSDDDPNNFYFEREWRVFGNIEFIIEDVARILLPQEFSKRFRADVPQYTGQISFTKVG